MKQLRIPALLALLVTAACDPQVPDSAAGFDRYDGYRLEREAALTGQPLDQPATVQPPAETDLAAPAQAPGTGGTVVVNNPGLSDEQSFEAVTARETIESDKERLARQGAAYEVITPTAVPERRTTGPNIVEYALSTSNGVGQSLYRRSGFTSEAAFKRNCIKYASDDLAQEAFLKAGGPERDRLNLDPDGDGFACYWDPAPFRMAVSR